ncbi:MAG: NYN domain-containing protein [Sphingobacteriaceae bacterium]|nr:NYN domain-containing protein [Sphingobacteriaceae bacterium]
MNEAIPNVEKERVTVYVDGFNLYFGMLEAGYHNCKWLNLKALALSLLKPNQELHSINYFTSRVSNNPSKQRRQTAYIEALETEDIHMFYGHYQKDSIVCKHCAHFWPKYNEKMTDVNIATQMLIDAYQDKYDMAMLISGDSDLVPPIKAIHENFKQKRVFVAFPPNRYNNSVELVAKGSLIIGRKKLLDNQFPEKVKKKDGYTLKKPETWS